MKTVLLNCVAYRRRLYKAVMVTKQHIKLGRLTSTNSPTIVLFLEVVGDCSTLVRRRKAFVG